MELCSLARPRARSSQAVVNKACDFVYEQQTAGSVARPHGANSKISAPSQMARMLSTNYIDNHDHPTALTKVALDRFFRDRSVSERRRPCRSARWRSRDSKDVEPDPFRGFGVGDR